ncbi:SDR family oxidoreductase [Dehalococcoidia bacterium]|nr:SDR family oxidoreductase [Dehalococcoidia bacterium]
MDLQLQGKTALVTGGSQGIGKAVALILAQEGVDVAISARTRETLDAAAEELVNETGRNIIPIAGDISRTEEVEAMVKKAISAFGRLDILVNSAGKAGGLAGNSLLGVTDEAVIEDLNTKFVGYLRVARAVAPFMQRQGWGRIINVGGLSARQSGSYSTGTRNIAIVHLSKTLSDELGPSGINVNVVHPGGTRKTSYIDNLIVKQAETQGISAEEAEARLGRNTAIGRLPETEEVASLVAFLASPKSAAVTGEVISAGGGTGSGLSL